MIVWKPPHYRDYSKKCTSFIRKIELASQRKTLIIGQTRNYCESVIQTILKGVRMHKFIPEGVCAKEISFELDNGKVKNLQFVKGCHGNLKGIAALAEGMQAEKIISRFSGITCKSKATSCPDQLACALKQAVVLESNL